MWVATAEKAPENLRSQVLFVVEAMGVELICTAPLQKISQIFLENSALLRSEIPLTEYASVS